MKNILTYIGFVILLSLCFSSCKKDDYKIGGDLHNPNINMTTYDFLKSNQYGTFDTLLMLVDKAGLKDKINESGITFFAPTDYAINRYVSARTAAVQKVDPFKMWTVDSIMKYEMDRFKDSLNLYIVKENLPNASLSKKGKIYKNLMNNNVVVSYEETTDPNMGYNENSSVLPQVVYFTYLYQELPSDFDVTQIQYPVGVRTLVQSSNAQTTTGTVQVLTNSHTLFYYR